MDRTQVVAYLLVAAALGLFVFYRWRQPDSRRWSLRKKWGDYILIGLVLLILLGRYYFGWSGVLRVVAIFLLLGAASLAVMVVAVVLDDPHKYDRRTILQWVSAITAVAFLSIAFGGYLFEWKWTGLPNKTFQNWLDIFLVPAVLAIGGYLFNRSENRTTRAIAERRTQDEALQAYLDNMADMLLTDKDQPSLYDEHPPDRLRAVARARTLTVLPRLSGNLKGRVVQFLYEADLITKDDLILDLSGADLREADLRGANLNQVSLRGADLAEVDLGGAQLNGADLSGAYAGGTDLKGANLSEAHLEETNLVTADLEGANLSYASGITNEELERQAKSLKGVTMPNGQKYEDWLKDKKAREEDGQNGGSP